MRLVTASANHDLDEILDLIGYMLQLTRPQFEDAEARYRAVGRWLNADNSPLRLFFPEIYAQGSMRLDTTLRPLSYTEFDIDLVCQMLAPGMTPLQVYNLLLARMRSNKRYAEIIRLLPRCIRLDYAGQFHLDIIPSIQDPRCPPGETCILVPDREKKIWLASNPLGYAKWFEVQTSKRKLQEKAAQFSANANVEPLRTPTPAYMKPPLKLAVQLLKRWRDVAFCGREDLAPSSIILTTLSGHFYNGEDHPTDALATILDGIYLWSQQVEQIELVNPTNDKELITDRWREKPEAYDAFIDSAYAFRVAWHKLIEHGRYPAFIGDLQDMFEESPVVHAITKFAEHRGEARRNGSLVIEKSSGALGVKPTAPASSGFIKVKEHTFHGQ